jgi:hypothetical protein
MIHNKDLRLAYEFHSTRYTGYRALKEIPEFNSGIFISSNAAVIEKEFSAFLLSFPKGICVCSLYTMKETAIVAAISFRKTFLPANHL